MFRSVLKNCIIVGLMVSLVVSSSYGTVNLSLTSPIYPPKTTIVINKLNNTPRTELVILNIDSPGGLVSEELKIISAIKNHSNVSCVVNRYAASAAAMIFMACDRVKISNKASLVFHLGQAYYNGKQYIVNKSYSRLSRKTNQYYNYSLSLFNPFKHIFTQQEWSDLENGLDVTITGFQYNSRAGVK